MSIGTNIRRLREQRGLTQEKLAEMVGVSFQAVSSWERDEYKPDTDNLLRLMRELDVSSSAILEEPAGIFRARDAIYNWEHMKTFVKTSANIHKLPNTVKALDYAVRAHSGQKRKKSEIPYIYHPLNLACHALALGFTDDALIAACLLHDVVEDCEKTLEELPVDDDTRHLVALMSCPEKTDENRAEILDAYYEGILSDPKAALIKCLDRCNNLTTMSWGLSRDKIARMIRETEHYYPALLNAVRGVPEYNNAAWLLKYQIESMLDIYKRML